MRKSLFAALLVVALLSALSVYGTHHYNWTRHVRAGVLVDQTGEVYIP